MLAQLVVGFVIEAFDGRILDCPVHPLDLAVGPGMLGLGGSVIDVARRRQIVMRHEAPARLCNIEAPTTKEAGNARRSHGSEAADVQRFEDQTFERFATHPANGQQLRDVLGLERIHEFMLAEHPTLLARTARQRQERALI